MVVLETWAQRLISTAWAPSMALMLTLLGLRESPRCMHRMWQRKAKDRQKGVTAEAASAGEENSIES